MKLTCERTLLAEAITGVSKAVLTSNNGSPLEGILFHAEGFSLTLTGYNEQLAITTTLEANVQQPGDALLSARLLGDMVRRLNAEDIELSCDDNCTATVKGGITEFNILGMNPASYPSLPRPATDHALDLPAAGLKEIVETTLYAVSLDDKKPAHTGELFVIEPEKLTVVALDGFRLAIVSGSRSALNQSETDSGTPPGKN